MDAMAHISDDPNAPAATGGLDLPEYEFEIIRSLVHTRLGIFLTAEKHAMVVARLQTVVREHGFGSFAEYCQYLQSDTSGHSLIELADRISTHHSFFYREPGHFRYLAHHGLPEVTGRRKVERRRAIRIWSAGCAEGEEAYTVVMMLLEHFGATYKSWDTGVLATDISARSLDAARRGVYKADRLKHLPSHLRLSYFTHEGNNSWKVVPSVQREVTFRRLNLMNPRFPFKQPFDFIFCRNVMIYFDASTREALVRRLFEYTAPGGYLFIGHSESLPRSCCPYEFMESATYRRPLES